MMLLSSFLVLLVLLSQHYETVSTPSILITTGVPVRDNHASISRYCTFLNSTPTFLWDGVNASNRFFDINPLDESQLQRGRASNSPFRALFVLSDTFPRKRFKDYEYVESSFPVVDAYHYQRKMAIFHDVWVNNLGLIVSKVTGDCRAVRNGGCTINESPEIFKLKDSPVKYDNVLSIAASASSTWHFPMECLVALAGVPMDLISNSMILVTRKSPYIVEWLTTIFPTINPNRIIDNEFIHAKHLYVPEMARCGKPFPTQLQWLRQQMQNVSFDANFPNHVNKYLHNGHPIINIVFVFRSGSRKLSNGKQMLEHTKLFAEANNLNVTVHHDKDLPSIKDQIKLFATSHIVVAPHGAALLFTAFSPPNACIIEFMFPRYPDCYARIAYLRGLHYVMSMVEENGQVSNHQLESALELCRSKVQGGIGNSVDSLFEGPEAVAARKKQKIKYGSGKRKRVKSKPVKSVVIKEVPDRLGISTVSSVIIQK